MDDIETHLREALDTNDPVEKNFHIRHALQLYGEVGQSGSEGLAVGGRDRR